MRARGSEALRAVGRKYWTGGREGGMEKGKREERREGERKAGRQGKAGGKKGGRREDRPLFLLGQDPHGDLSGPAPGLDTPKTLDETLVERENEWPPGREALRTKHSGY